MRSALATLVFAVAAGSAAVAGSGVVLAPHTDPVGTPVFHRHEITAYRLPFFLGSADQPPEHAPVLSAQGVMPLEGTLALALLAVAWLALARPALRSVGRPHPIGLPSALWRPPLLLGPPRDARGRPIP